MGYSDFARQIVCKSDEIDELEESSGLIRSPSKAERETATRRRKEAVALTSEGDVGVFKYFRGSSDRGE